MKKLTHGLGVLAIGIFSTTAFSGCSSTPDPGTGTGGMASTGGTGNTAGGPQVGVQVQPPNSYIILSATDAMPGATAAPPAWDKSTCSTCHGTVGQGVQSLAPEIRHVPAAYAKQVVRQGRKFNGVQDGMVAFPMTSSDPLVAAITDADLDAVISWLDGQPKPTSGQGLFLDFCGNCHGKDGNGGIEPVKVTGETISLVNTRVRSGFGTDITMRNAYMPTEDTTALTDAELTLIEQYIMAK